MHHKREIGSHSSTMHYSKCVVTGIMCIGRCGQLTVLTYGTGGRDGGLFIISFTSLVEYFYPSGKWRRINESLHYLYIATNTETYMEVSFDQHTMHKYSEALDKDRQTIVVHKWNNMDKCSSI